MARAHAASIALTCIALAAVSAHAQIRRQPAAAETVSVEVALTVGSRTYAFSGPGECKGAPRASIHGVPAALYSASHVAGTRSVRLTLWQPKGGAADMMQLSVADGATRFEVDTVKAGAKRDTRGSGTATLEKSGAGGVFAIDAATAAGEKIRGKIRCSRFAELHAEGG